MTSILSTISSPANLRGLTWAQLDQLAEEIRAELIRVVSKNGGHLGANLGTVELSIALHVAFNSPKDMLVWDVGHQAYIHKLLTGRLDRFPTIRQEGGISGFLSRDESEHDQFGAGHASTSISAALGMAVAQEYKPKSERGRAVAIIGDGALTGGMAFEGLNNAGHLNLPFIVVLNDNEMSIAPNVGALSKYLDKVRTDKTYNRAKDELAARTARLPQGELLVELGKRMKDSLKEFVYHAMIWEELGFTYIGPIDGHDIRAMADAFRQAAQVEGPVFVHVITQKGKGYALTENDGERGHAVSAPVLPGSAPTGPKYQDVFAQALIELARDDERILAITAAMPTGTSLNKFDQVFPKRCFDVGIAEQHAVTFAAGLATQGMKPVCAIYSTFLQRAYDQIIHDVAIQKLPVVFCLDRAGFAGDDGRTHHGVYDLTYLRPIPGMIIMAPKDENELRHMLKTAFTVTDAPVAIRYARGAGLGVPISEPMHVLPIGKGELLREGTDVAILAAGTMVAPSLGAADLLAAEGFSSSVVNARFVKPLDEALILDQARRCGAIVTVEESAELGGFGSAVLELLAREGLTIPVHTVAIPDQIFEHASQGKLRELAGLSPASIANAARGVIALSQPISGERVKV
jgi:1-deoxy-D-xylulose-5-phosphate synthase